MGNDDPSSVDDQPDYDGMAEHLRLRLQDRVRQVPPLEVACARMIAAARELYEQVPAPAATREELEAELRATLARDETACRREASPRAALCVAIMLEEERRELDWAVDQCARAFPRQGPPAADDPAGRGPRPGSKGA